MIASVHIADIGAGAALRVLRKAPERGSVPGLRHADIGLAAPLSGSLRPSLQPGRVGLFALWDDDAALDRFLAGHPLADTMSDGWRLRLTPLRAHGSWPGLDEDLPSGRIVDHEGPAAVVTLGRVRLSRIVAFTRTSARAEGRLLAAPGMLWATGLARPPFLATCSLWRDTRALSTYAYGASHPEHVDAVAADRARPFHVRSAFIRFAPSDSHGHLDGRNPLTEGWTAPASEPRS